jgi:hypothetical protein
MREAVCYACAMTRSTVLRWILFVLGAPVLALCGFVAILGAMDLLSHLPFASAAFFLATASAGWLIVASALHRTHLAAAAALVISSLAAWALSPAVSFSKAGADRAAVLMLLVIPSIVGAALAVGSGAIGARASRPVADSRSP